ncbi:hypothetical protein [Embleya sp. NPDC001921]
MTEPRPGGSREIATGTRICDVPWQACPEHGSAIYRLAELTYCGNGECERVWETKQAECANPAAFRFVDIAGSECVICPGHAVDFRNQGAGTMTPLFEPQDPRHAT